VRDFDLAYARFGSCVDGARLTRALLR